MATSLFLSHRGRGRGHGRGPIREEERVAKEQGTAARN